MNKEELYKLVNKEIEWLIYYGYRADREKLTINSNIYEEVNSIGYTKRKMPLDQRCAPCILTANEIITKDLDLEKLTICYEKRDNSKNKYTPLEVYLILFPDERNDIIEKIKNIKEDKNLIFYGYKN